MAYLKCYNFQPHQFKLTHDISIENFTALDDDDGVDEELVEDSMKLFHFDLHDNHNFVQSVNHCENENELKDAQTKALRNNSRANSTLSLDSLNLKNASLSSSYSEPKDGVPDSQDPFKGSLTSLNSLGLRIEDVGKISSELVKVDLQNHNGYQRDGMRQHTTSRSSSGSSEPPPSQEKIDVKDLGLQKPAPKDDTVFASLRRNVSQESDGSTSQQSVESDPQDSPGLVDTLAAAAAAPSPVSPPSFPQPSTSSASSSASTSAVPRRRPRRPRKLPEIPAHATSRITTSKGPVPLSSLLQPVSLADELHQAELGGQGQSSPAPNRGLSFFRGGERPHQCSRYHSINFEELGSPDQVDPTHKQQLDESLTSIGSCEKSCCECDSKCPNGTAPTRTVSLHEELTQSQHLEQQQLEQQQQSSEDSVETSVGRTLSDSLGNLNFNTVSGTTRAFLAANNPYLCEDSSPEEKWKVSPKHQSSPSGSSSHSEVSVLSKRRGRIESKSSAASTRSPSVSSSFSPCPELEDYEPTHRGCHKFVPRHDDEIFVEIGDPIYVEVEADDLWCEGLNLRTGRKGIFPAAYATDLDLLEEGFDGTRPFRFQLKFLGSVEVIYHKGTDVLCQAIHKVAMTRRMTLNTTPPPVCLLEINEYGIKMTDKSKKKKKKAQTPSPKKSSLAKRLAKLLSKVQHEREANDNNDHFFSLKNVSFCGYHPKNDKYFAFITKHPLDLRFACHVYQAERSTRPIAEAVGEAFRRFYQEYMAFMHPTEDIYME